MKRKQFHFDGLNPTEYKKPFGGELLKSHPKRERPLSFKQSMHLVLRSSQAKGRFSFLEPKRAIAIKKIIQRQSALSAVKILRYANSGNHLHLLIQPRNRMGYRKFIRAATGLIARLVLKTERGCGYGKKFWDKRPFTRIIAWGREFTTVSRYLVQNILEAWKIIPYKPRDKKPALVI